MGYKRRKILLIYGLVGVVFGLCFPVGAILFETYMQQMPMTISNIRLFHKNTPVLYMIDTAPIFLGVFALVGGISRAKAEQTNQELTEVIKEVKKTNEEKETLFQKIEKELNTNNLMRVAIKKSSSGLVTATNNLRDKVIDITELGTNVHDEVLDITSNVLDIRAISEAVVEMSMNFNHDANEMHDEMVSSKEILGQYIASTSSIVSELVKLDDILEGLALKSKEVEGVAAIVNDISSNIKLLALNASIEAARAGDYGKGFAVVASEIQRLSSQTGQALDDVSRKIKNVTSEVEVSRRSMAYVSSEGEKLKSSSNHMVTTINVLEGRINDVKKGSNVITSETKQQGQAINNIGDKAQSLISRSEQLRCLLDDSNKLIKQTDMDIMDLKKHLVAK